MHRISDFCSARLRSKFVFVFPLPYVVTPLSSNLYLDYSFAYGCSCHDLPLFCFFLTDVVSQTQNSYGSFLHFLLC